MPRRNDNRDLTSLTHIEELIDNGGEITIGHVGALCVASACDESSCLAMLRRRKGETFTQILARLDAAVARAWSDEIFTDEINASD